MNSPIARAISYCALRRPWLVIIVSILLTLGLVKGLERLTFSNDYRDYFSQENPQLMEWEQLQAVFGKTDNVLLAVSVPEGDLFTPTRLATLQAITEEGWQLPHAKRVDSVTNHQHIEPVGADDIHVGDLVSAPQALSSKALKNIRQTALNHPQLVHRLINAEGTTAAVNIEVLLPERPREQIAEVSEAANRWKADLEQRYPGFEFHISGSVPYNYAMTSATKQDMKTLMPGMFLLILVLFGLMTRSVTTTVATAVLMVFTIMGTMGMAAWWGVVLMAPSLSAPTIVMTLAVANAVHLILTFFARYRGDTTKADALEHTISVNVAPVVVTNLTTAIGFLSMNFSDVPPYRDLGNMVAGGIVLVVLYSLLLLPALLRLLPVKAKSGTPRSLTLYQGLSGFVQRRYRMISAGFLGVLALSAIGISQLELNDRFIEWMDSRYEFRRDSDFINNELTGLYRLDWGLEAGEQSGITRPDYLNALSQLTEWAREQPGVVHVHSLSDTLKELNQKFHGGDAAYYRVPDSQELAAQLLLIYELSLPMGRDLGNMINVSKSSSRFVLRTANLSTNQLLALERRTNEWIAEHPGPIVTSEAGSTSILFANISQRNIRSLLIGTFCALILISFILILPLRSLKFGLMSLVPNLLPATVAFGVWGLLVQEVGLAISVVIGMTMGIVVDDTVHFMTKYLRRRREGAPTEEALNDTFTNVGPALFGTTLILMFGFLLLAQSGFEVNQQMGALTALVIVIALVADFLLLPSLIMWFDRKAIAHESSPAPVQSVGDKPALGSEADFSY